MNKKATDIVAYLGIIGWLIAYFAGSKEESKFHLNQALVLAIGELAAGILMGIFSGFLYWIFSIAQLAVVVLAIIGFIGACKGEEKPVPVLGTIQVLK